MAKTRTSTKPDASPIVVPVPDGRLFETKVDSISNGDQVYTAIDGRVTLPRSEAWYWPLVEVRVLIPLEE